MGTRSSVHVFLGLLVSSFVCGCVASVSEGDIVEHLLETELDLYNNASALTFVVTEGGIVDTYKLLEGFGNSQIIHLAFSDDVKSAVTENHILCSMKIDHLLALQFLRAGSYRFDISIQDSTFVALSQYADLEFIEELGHVISHARTTFIVLPLQLRIRNSTEFDGAEGSLTMEDVLSQAGDHAQLKLRIVQVGTFSRTVHILSQKVTYPAALYKIEILKDARNTLWSDVCKALEAVGCKDVVHLCSSFERWRDRTASSSPSRIDADDRGSDAIFDHTPYLKAMYRLFDWRAFVLGFLVHVMVVSVVRMQRARELVVEHALRRKGVLSAAAFGSIVLAGCALWYHGGALGSDMRHRIILAPSSSGKTTFINEYADIHIISPDGDDGNDISFDVPASDPLLRGEHGWVHNKRLVKLYEQWSLHDGSDVIARNIGYPNTRDWFLRPEYLAYEQAVVDFIHRFLCAQDKASALLANFTRRQLAYLSSLLESQRTYCNVDVVVVLPFERDHQLLWKTRLDTYLQDGDAANIPFPSVWTDIEGNRNILLDASLQYKWAMRVTFAEGLGPLDYSQLSQPA